MHAGQRDPNRPAVCGRARRRTGLWCGALILILVNRVSSFHHTIPRVWPGRTPSPVPPRDLFSVPDAPALLCPVAGAVQGYRDAQLVGCGGAGAYRCGLLPAASKVIGWVRACAGVEPSCVGGKCGLAGALGAVAPLRGAGPPKMARGPIAIGRGLQSSVTDSRQTKKFDLTHHKKINRRI